MGRFAVILAAAGKSRRFADPLHKKVFSMVGPKPIWQYSAEVFSNRKDVGQLILVIAKEDRDFFNEKYAGNAAMLGIQTVLGGDERADSVRCGLDAVRDDMEFVAVHDAARPCIADAWIDAVFAKAVGSGAAILATPCHATLKRADKNLNITQTVPRDHLWMAQTPQVFRSELLRKGYEACPNPSAATDEAAIVEATGHAVSLVEGSPLNVKVTTKADIKFVNLALKALPKSNPFPF